MAKKKNIKSSFIFPADEKTGKSKGISVNPDENPTEFVDRFSAVAATNPGSLQEFIQRLDKTGKEPL